MKETKLCKQCGKEFTPCHKTSEFCSKSCATRYRNNEKIKDGTHNFYNIDRGKTARIRIENGTHPFLKGNMSEESLKKKAEGIKLARIKESQEHRHPWQNPRNFIENEYSLSLGRIKKRGLSIVYLYIADCEYDNTFKIGWTYDIKIREKDPRCHDLKNLSIIKSGNPEEIIKLEKEIKIKFFNEKYYSDYKSTEIFPNELKSEILNYINLK